MVAQVSKKSDASRTESKRITGDILIIDDVYEDIMVLESILRAAGYKIRATRDSISGLRAARAEVPDLILLDIMLPGFDGFKVCQQIRADERLAEVPVVFVSALHDVNLKAQAFEAGGYDYITKPYHPKEVLVRIQHQLERVQLRVEWEQMTRTSERQHIARELHDSVNQTLFILSASVQALMMDADSFPPQYREQLANLNTLSKSALAEMRTLLNELRPAQITQVSIRKLLHQLVDAFRLRLGSDVHTVIVDGDLPDGVKLAFYRIAQEALTNAAKYADATRLSVSFLADGSQYRLIIEDNGSGFDYSEIQPGMGLYTMRERAEQQDMGFNLNSTPGQGTRIEVIWQS